VRSHPSGHDSVGGDRSDGENLPGFIGTDLAEMGGTPLTRHAPGRNMKEINMIRNIAAALSAFALASFGAFAQTGSTGSTSGSSDTSATTTTKSDSTGNMKHSKKASKKASKKSSKKASKKASGDMGATGSSSTTTPK
jgi:hypothetical protein